MHLRQVSCYVLLCAVLCAGRMTLAATTAKPVVYDIPRLDNITIDGKGDDWGTRGFRVDAFKDVSESLLDNPRTALSDVTMRMGWDARGLLLLDQRRRCEPDGSKTRKSRSGGKIPSNYTCKISWAARISTSSW